MFAKIMIGNEVYVSPVMALTLSGWNSKAVVLNADSSKLIVVDLYRSNSSNQFLLIDYNHDSFEIVENNFKSYWNKRNIFKIVKSKKYTLEMLNEAKNILDNFNDSKYIDVKSNKDLEMLELNTGSFHDAYILAMKQKGSGLEIVFDTTWGSLVVLKCSEIIENSLNVGDTFFHCDMRIDEKEQYIEFNFDSPKYNEERVLKVNKISLNFLFEKQTVLKSFDYSIDDNEIKLKLNNIDYSFSYRDIHNDFLDLKERNVIGYIDNDNDTVKCFILLENYVLSFYSYNISNKENAERTLLLNKVNEFKNKCKLHNLYFDDFPWCDYFGVPIEERLGELIFSQKYSRIYGLLNMIKYIMIAPLGWNILCLIIQLLNPEMKWAFYLIFGIGIPVVTLLITLVIIIKELLSKNSSFDSCFEIREKGILYVNGYRAIETNFEGISNLTYEDKISFYVNNKKYTLHKSKNDKKMYELIKEKYDGISRQIMGKEYTFEFYGTKQQLLNKISSNILDNNFSYPKTFYIGEYMIYVTSDKIEFGIQRGGHSGGYWYIPAIEEFEDHLVLSGKIRYIGPEDNRGKASKVIGEIFFVLFIILLSPILLLFKIYELIDWIVRKISKKPKPITTEGKLLDLMVNKLGCIKK